MDIGCLVGNPQVAQYAVTFENTGKMIADRVLYRVQYFDESGTVFAESDMGYEEYPGPGNQAVANNFAYVGWSCDMIEEDVYDAVGAGRVDFVISEKKF